MHHVSTRYITVFAKGRRSVTIQTLMQIESPHAETTVQIVRAEFVRDS